MLGTKESVIFHLLWLLFCIEGFVGFEFKKNILCESLSGYLTCPRSDDVVVVKRAIYGRRLPFPKVCGDLSGRPPCSMDTTATLLPYCFSRQTCTFLNTDKFHGKPCKVAQQGKYLTYDGACVPVEDIYPVCGTTSSNDTAALPLPEQGLLAPPFYSTRKQRPWRCDVRISGATSMTFEVINDDNGRVPVMACGRNIFVGDLRASPGCRPLSKDQIYKTKGDVNVYFYNTNDTGPQALVYYQVIQKDVLSILTAARQVHSEFSVEPSTVFPLIPIDPSQDSTNAESTVSAVTESSVFDNETSSVSTEGDYDYDYENTTTTEGLAAEISTEESNTTDSNFQIDFNTTEPIKRVVSTLSTVASTGKTEPPQLISGNNIPVNSSNKSPSGSDNKVGSIPAYLVGIIVGVLGLIILLLIIAFIVAVCKRRDKAYHQEDMNTLSQDRDKGREMNIYSTIDLHEESTSDKPSYIRSKKNKEDTIEKTKAAAAKDKNNSTFNPSEIWSFDESVPSFYFSVSPC